ncbi:hypothetical protein DRW07_07490 [Alteromonas sediminis]|uniref:Uncharacterized protein n=1 Tax=Alteromonas sediminis TaxID=2259342 RepID=A0A3N5Y192_9ALTE|nr:hypothetical protein [Alteromonas sediminis]RPJ67362.1 hypothetical protein DRW07_07490 [Alteromonas sediminis]
MSDNIRACITGDLEMGKDFRFNKNEWADDSSAVNHKRDSQKRQRKVEQKRKDKLRTTHE